MLLLIAVGYVVWLRRRLALVADAEHELRGPVTALSLGIEALARAAGRPHGLDCDLARVRLALEDLGAARSGRRARASSELRSAQALGNLVANAEEHGGGLRSVSSRQVGSLLRLEVADRGRGMAIARRAAADAGGRVDLDLRPGGSLAVLELPAPEA
ncbi:MAG: hypothetical protein H0V29_09915 [Thermoleophilaceae bacterium]|nr:hypothetical protein [Thermoleophilaceae bacterium]